MTVKYGVSLKDKDGWYINTHDIFDNLEDAEKAMKILAKERDIKIGYQDGRCGYIEVDVVYE